LLLFLFPIFSFQCFSQESEAREIWTEGIAFMKAGDYMQGIERMDEYLNFFPASAFAYSNRGVCHFNMGDEEHGCFDWQQAMAIGFKGKKKAYEYFCSKPDKVALLQKYFYKDMKLDPENGYRPQYTRADSLRGSLRPERSCYDVYYYDLTVRIHPRSRSVTGYNEIYFKGVTESSEIQIDLFENMFIDKISLDGTVLKYHREFNAIFIEMPGNIVKDEDYRIRVEYSGLPRKAPNPPWEGGFIWRHDKKFNWWVGVACEHLGASSWWPTKDHLSDRPDSMGLHIEVPEKYQAVSNGQHRSTEILGDGYARFNWHVGYPINNYNATFYMGRFAEFTDTILWKDSILIARYHVLPYNLRKAKEHFRQVNDVVRFYNDAFGPFPFWNDNFRMVESPYEGMEHQTAIAYGNAYSVKKNSSGYLNTLFDYIIVHEAAHEWWGNAVAADDMADIWLHEGFATYSEYLFLEHMLGYDAAMKELQHHLSSIVNIWPMVHNRGVNEDAFASNDVYTKGAAMLQSLRSSLDNDSLFRSILYDFNMIYRDSICNTEVFVEFFNERSEKDFSAFFDKYLYETSLPVLSYSYERVGTGLKLRYRWSGVGDGFEMPYSLKLIPGGESVRLVASTVEKEVVFEETESFRFYNQWYFPDGCPRNGLTYYATSLSKPFCFLQQ
jgi:aminopeptidase N